MKPAIFAASHALTLCAGIALGVYFLPVFVEPPGLSKTQLQEVAQSAKFSGQFLRNLKGSDFIHWAEGTVFITNQEVALDGQVAPGPDYKLYLSPAFVQTINEFESAKPHMVKVGDIRAFHNFRAKLPEGVDPADYNTVVVWCETFHQFISAAKYR